MPITNVKQGANVTITHPELVDLNGCTIGDEARIGPFVGIAPGSVIGARCQISAHAFICEGVIIEDDVFLGNGVIFTHTLYPSVARLSAGAGAGPGATGGQVAATLIKRGASIGSNATIVAGITIGAGALVGAGAVVTRNVPDRCLVAGVPARVMGYVSLRQKRREALHHARAVLSDSAKRKPKASRHH
jgi:acetyltransferase-like isoleucine patch superfamily enzyme